MSGFMVKFLINPGVVFSLIWVLSMEFFSAILTCWKKDMGGREFASKRIFKLMKSLFGSEAEFA